jgi:hypothetical protein
LAEVLHGKDVGSDEVDWDFITPRATARTTLPKKDVNQYEIISSSYDSPRFTSKATGNNIDLIDLRDAHGIKGRLTANVYGYLKAVPLDVQSIALNLVKMELIGHGVAAVVRRHININNMEELAHAAKNKSVTPAEFVRNKANTLGFTWNGP